MRTPARGIPEWTRPGRRELIIVGIAIAVGIALRVAYVLATQDHTLAGDEIEYDIEGRFAADGKFLWTTTPYGEAHASTWKAPGYTAWVGLLYAVLGVDPDRVLAAQAILLPPISIGLTWALGRALFGAAAGIVAAAIMAVYPGAWQFEVRLFSESLALPLTAGLLLVVLTATRVTTRRAAAAGAVLGLLVLVKPSAVFLAPVIAATWWATAGARTGTARLIVSGLVTVLVVAPWSIRNYVLDSEHWVPLSVQGAAGFGTFNDDAANDKENPWAWRYQTKRDRDIFAEPRPDGQLYAELNTRTREFIREDPTSVLKSFYWNGITRLWDLRPPSAALHEVRFQGRTRTVAAIALGTYWILLALAVVGLSLLWRHGRRRLVIVIGVLALSASAVYTTEGTTRYRVPIEPLVVVLAAFTLTAAAPQRLFRGSHWT